MLVEEQTGTLAIMHGASFSGDGDTALHELATAYEQPFPELCLGGGAPSVPAQAGGSAAVPAG